jgi:hypothetical protein
MRTFKNDYRLFIQEPLITPIPPGSRIPFQYKIDPVSRGPSILNKPLPEKQKNTFPSGKKFSDINIFSETECLSNTPLQIHNEFHG